MLYFLLFYKSFRRNSMRNNRALLSAAALAFLSLVCETAQADVLTDFTSELGLGPEPLVIAEMSPGGAGEMIAKFEAETGLREQLGIQRASADAAIQTASETAAAMSASPAQDLTDQYQAALSALALAQEAIVGIRDQLFAAVTDELSTSQVGRLNIWRLSAGLQVPPEFRVTVRTPEQWHAIELALRAEARALRYGEDVPGDAAQLLGQVRAESNVIAAQSLLSQNMAAMQSSLETPSQ